MVVDVKAKEVEALQKNLNDAIKVSGYHNLILIFKLYLLIQALPI